ncbi:MAG: hypothetical protein SFT94_12685 [Pseudanabaenaceae cyanobacterium bins.68]|nr:hypothetical protein [Pseudanabaenaceae cyanobacterium bins.68]
MYNTDHLDAKFAQIVLGAATFDLSGLPREYFVPRTGNHQITWVQTIFQVLGIRSLLASSVKLEGFSHAILRGEQYSALVVKQPNGYFAILTAPDAPALGDTAMIAWTKQLNANQFKKNPQFQVV